MAEHDARHEPVYAAAKLGQLGPVVRRVGTAVGGVVLALAVAVGLAAPVLASPAPRAATPAARPHGAGTISGQVTFTDGYGNRPNYVVVRDGHYSREVPVSHYDGRYFVGRLPPGSYRVTFDRISGFSLYEAQFWDGHPESSGVGQADRVTVAAAQHVDNVDATLRTGGTITGTLVDGQQHPLANCRLQAYTTDGTLVTRSGRSGTDGSFTITGLTTGAYLVRVLRHGTESDCDGPRQYLVSRTGGALGGQAAGVPVSARVGASVAVGTQVYAGAGKIAGQVKLPPGSTTHDHYVVARNTARPGFSVKARVHLDGSYVLRGLVTGSYRVTFDRLSGEAFDEAAFYRGHPESAGPRSHDPVGVTRGRTTTLRAVSLRAGGSITGTLVDPGGTPLDRCKIQAYTADGQLVTRSAVSGVDGSYVIGGLSTGRYLVRVLHGQRKTGCNAPGQKFYDGSRTLSLGGPQHPARPVSVRVGRATALGRVTYAVGASISGTVSVGRSHYFFGDYVVARRGTHAVRSAINRDGTYQIRGLRAGSYRVTFDRISGYSDFEAQFYDGHPESETRASADRVVLAPGEQRTGIDATLQVGHVISGRLVDADGNGLRCALQAFTTDGHLVTRVDDDPERDGTFHITGLSTGRYYLRALGSRSHCNAGTQYLGKSGQLVATGPGKLVTVTSSADTSVGTLRYQAALVVTAPPTVTGTPQVGSTLTATPGQWDPADGLSFAYQWLSAGLPVAGATGTTYSPTAADVGHPVAVQVTASRAGYVARSARSAPTAPVVAGVFTLKQPPKVTGQPTVGQVLTVGGAKISPTPTATTYQWLRAGTPVRGATAATYRVVKADRGHPLTVQVTYHRTGYTDLVVTTKAVAVP